MFNFKQTFSQLYDNYVEKIYRFVFIKVNSREIAEDLTSETFLRAWKRFQDNREKIRNHSAFFYQIARNLVTDYYRGKDKMKVVSAEYDQIVDPGINFEDKAVFNSDLESVKKAILCLKDSYQEVIIWHYLDDLSIPEIADLSKKSEGNVRVNLHRALEALKNELAEIKKV